VPLVRAAPTTAIDHPTLYAILALRSAVFVVEQNCVYQDLDGRDLEPDAQQLWIEQGGAVVAALRLLTDPGGELHIGRVITAPAARGQGLASTLMWRALELAGDAPVEIKAQSYLRDWYARFGFAQTGAEFVEDGIPHVPMRRS